MTDPDADSELLGQVYEAALDPARWPQAMAAIGARIDAQSAFLFSAHSPVEPKAMLQVHNQPAEMAEQFVSHWHVHDPWALAARRFDRMRRGTLVVGTELLPQAMFRHTAFSADFARHFDIDAMLGSVLFDGTEDDPMPFTNLCWYRPARRPGFQARDKAAVQRVLPHVRRALRLQRQLRALDGRRNPSAVALDSLEVASIVLDDALDVLECNPAGATLLGTRGTGYRHGQLRALGLDCAPSLAQAMAQCRGSLPVHIAMRLARPAPAVVKATLLALAPDQATTPGPAQLPRYLLLVPLPRAPLGTLGPQVADLFGLSAAELRVLEALLEGRSPGEAAEALGVSITTVRTHIQRLLAKTGTSRQVDLVRLLAGLRG